jgi:dTDP-4-dehydrorhamnose 3,5-epimerase
MDVRPLAVEGAFEFAPVVHRDQRGVFVSPFQEPVFRRTVGVDFVLAQTNHSQSSRGVVRGVHFTRTPPGQRKYVYCARGRALDVVVDLRVGSPSFLKWEAVELDAESFRAVYFPVGVGHAFCALEDDTVMSYLMSMSYEPEMELAVHPLDPSLNLPWPQDVDLLLSERDRRAPGVAEAEQAGILPRHADSRP